MNSVYGDVICVQMHKYTQLCGCDLFSPNIMHHFTAMTGIPNLHPYIEGSPVASSQWGASVGLLGSVH